MNDHLTDIWNEQQRRRCEEWTATYGARPKVIGGQHFAERPSLLRRILKGLS